MNTTRGVLTLLINYTYMTLTGSEISISTNDLSINLNKEEKFIVEFGNLNVSNAKFNFIVEYSDIVEISPRSIDLYTTRRKQCIFKARGNSPGRTIVVANSTADLNLEDVFITVSVYKNKTIHTLSTLVGWGYFIAWSLAYYPQIRINYLRQRVNGLHIDYFVFSFLGIAFYALFNVVLYMMSEIQDEYYRRFPRSLIPVRLNDVLYSVHGTAMSLIIIGQFIKYEGGQNPPLSTTAKIFLAIFTISFVVLFLLAAEAAISWLDFINYCSFIGIVTSLIKFLPQVYLNYKFGAAIGVSIATVLLDIIGGTFSIMQMILDSYNYNDWVSMLGDFTKFGLGMNSLIFDLIIVYQYAVLYKHTKYELQSKS